MRKVLQLLKEASFLRTRLFHVAGRVARLLLPRLRTRRVSGLVQVTAMVVVEHVAEGTFLLVQEGRGLDAGRFNHPEGRAEPGESVVRTAVRELSQEAGVEVSPEELELLGFITDQRDDLASRLGGVTPQALIAVYYLAYSGRTDLQPQDPDICSLKWVSFSELEQMDEQNQLRGKSVFEAAKLARARRFLSKDAMVHVITQATAATVLV